MDELNLTAQSPKYEVCLDLFSSCPPVDDMILSVS